MNRWIPPLSAYPICVAPKGVKNLIFGHFDLTYKLFFSKLSYCILFRWECEHWNARKVRPADWMGIMSTTVTVWWATKIIPKNKTAPRKMNLTTLFPPCVPATFSGKIWTNSSGVAKSDTLRLVSTEWIHFYASGKVTESTITSNRGTNSFFHL